eukprot:CAMPEP_0171092810 /NCGR_PEP_ID=MMETSP0766_2-20121228/37516_1 /TAXON_ID=439317 /ORGANISM="Gambierdiscus australes, Strain CAWD 149" /LENGTH=65 /DNA_ID=CAMNT_0011551121 /DNA_START=60 /DNA_END=257 /DNA_ORIENTATION=+
MPVRFFKNDKALCIAVDLPGGTKGLLMPEKVLSESYTQRLQGKTEQYEAEQAAALKKKAASEKKR